jgi:hypothetical protein
MNNFTKDNTINLVNMSYVKLFMDKLEEGYTDDKWKNAAFLLNKIVDAQKFLSYRQK